MGLQRCVSRDGVTAISHLASEGKQQGQMGSAQQNWDPIGEAVRRQAEEEGAAAYVCTMLRYQRKPDARKRTKKWGSGGYQEYDTEVPDIEGEDLDFDRLQSRPEQDGMRWWAAMKGGGGKGGLARKGGFGEERARLVGVVARAGGCRYLPTRSLGGVRY
eukprot:1933582-Rhodomonas_salina.2